jgi:hypothetical protein
MRSITFLIVTLIAVNTQAQRVMNDIPMLLNFGDDKNANHQIIITADYYANSNTVRNSFFDAAFSEGLISDEVKQETFSNLESLNRLGYLMDFGMVYSNNSIFKDMYFYAGWKATEHFNASFERDFFKLVFKGNKQFAGEHIDISPFDFNYFSYEKIFAGVSTSFTNASVYGSLSLLKGSKFQQGTINRGDMFTSVYGDSIQFNTIMDIYLGDEDNRRLGNFIGYGTAIDIGMVLKTGTKSYMQADIRDLGFINWTKGSRYKVEDSFEFTGNEIDGFFSNSDTVASTPSLDSITGLLGIDPENADLFYMLPGSFKLSYNYDFGENITITAGINLMINANYLPRLFLKSLILTEYDFAIYPQIMFFGYGNVDVALGISKKINNRYYFGFNSYYLEDLIAPSKTSGQGISFFGSVLF